MANYCSSAKCGICLQEFSAIEELDKHISTHNINHPFRCNYCEHVYSDVTELQEHVVSHNIDNPYLCGRCDRRYNSSTYLMLHQSYNINSKSDNEPSDNCDRNSSVTSSQISTFDASSASYHSENVDSCASISKSESSSPFKTVSVTLKENHSNDFQQSHHIMPSYVKLRDIGPLLSDLEKGKDAIVTNTEGKKSSSKDVCEYLFALPKDINKLTLCMSCCFPFLSSKPHTCQNSPDIMSKKCGFCEVVFKDKSSLQKHVLKIHQVKQNFCCLVCSLVLKKERDYIQHIICEHSRSSSNSKGKNYDSYYSQPTSKSRRLKGSPQKIIPSYQVVDKEMNISDRDDYLPNEHDLCYSSDNGNMTFEKGNCLAEDSGDKSCDLINGRSSNFLKNGCDILKNPISLLATVNRPIRKREIIDSFTSQHSVCHNCCHIVQNLIEHMKLHSYQERLKCGFCKLTLKTETAARHHYRSSHKERNKVSCNSCKWYGVSERRYIRHCLLIHKEDMNLILPEMPQQKSLSVLNPKPSSTETEMSKGLSSKSKTNIGSSLCRYCGVVSQNLVDHLTKHEPRDFKQCGFCKKKFSHRDNVSYHFRKSHKDRNNLVCQFCNEFRGSEEMYIEHFMKNHPNAQINHNSTATGKSCRPNRDISKSELTTNGNIKPDSQESGDPLLSINTRPHRKTRLSSHGSSEAIQAILNEEVTELAVCKHCCKLYPISELKEHVNGHSIQEKMHCGFCEKEFTHGVEVSRHQKLHHSKNIQCPFCPIVVSSHQNYIDHFLNCHYFDMKKGTLKSKLLLFVCEFCCEVHESRKLHYKTHTDFTACGVCGHTFSRKETVRRHFEYKHQEMKNMICPFCPNFIGSVNKYMKHYLENHKKGFILKEDEVYAESENEQVTISGFNDEHLFESENDTDDDDDDDDDDGAQKYHVCEFCSEIHKSLRDHYRKHKDFTICGFCGIELANKRNIQRHYAMKHKLKKEVACRLCNVVIGSEKKYIEHYLKEHKGEESSDEDDVETKLCLQIESAFNESNLEEFTQDHTIVNKPDMEKKLPPLRIPKHLLSIKDMGNFDTPNAKTGRTVQKPKHEDHLDSINMFSDEDSDSNTLPDFNLDDFSEDSRDNEHPVSSQFNVSSLTAKSQEDEILLNDVATGQITNNSNSYSGLVSVDVDSQIKNSETKPANESLALSSPEDVSFTTIIGKVVCVYCSKVQLDLKEHYKTHSLTDLRFCGFCKKRYPNRKYISDHYRVCHKNKENLSCRFCKNFRSGSEKSYINHFMKNHRDIMVETKVPDSGSSKTNLPKSEKKPDETDADDVCVEERRRVTGFCRDLSHLYVCQYCGEVYGKKSLDIHIKKHSKDALQHCGFCNVTFGKDTSVLVHYRTEHRDKETVKCRICPFFNGSQEGYIRHYWKYHRSERKQISEETLSFPLKELYKYFICEFCGGIYQGLQRHYLSHTDEEMCKCGICGVTLAAKSSVLRHYEAVHKKHNDFSCKQCQINIGSEDKYIKHRVQCHLSAAERKVHEESIEVEVKAGTSNKNRVKDARHDGDTTFDGSDNDDNFDEQTKEQVTFECETCNETFSHQYLLRLHRKCHTENKLKCDLCDFICFGEGALRLHKRRVHNIKIELKCEVCDEVFSTHKAYLSHLKSSHDGYFPHPCPDCPKKFYEKKSLSNHVKKFHTPDAKFRYTCKTCNKGFDYKGSLTNHLRLHSNDRPFVCEVCGKGFRNKITLRVHQNIHSDNRPYKCKYCGKGFRQVSTEQNHRRIHTGEKPYMCHICGKSFHDRGHFHAHKKSSHKNELNLNTAPRERKPSSTHKSSAPIFPNGTSNPDNSAKRPSHENNVTYNSEMASAVRSIAETETPRVPSHQQTENYQNYFNPVLYPHHAWIPQTK